MAVSQKQIAEKLGVSIALVSRVLSGKAHQIGIAPDTIERVLKTAKEMAYVPSAAALILKGKSARTIGVAVYDFNDPFFGALIKEIQAQAREHDYSLVLTGFLNRVPVAQDLQSLHKHAIDGLIVIGTEMEAAWLEPFRDLPIARIGHGSPSEHSVRVATDETAAARLLVDHLQGAGRTRLVYLQAALPAHEIRAKHIEQAAQAVGINYTTERSSERDAFAAGKQGAQAIIEAGTDVDALVCATDLVAIGALHALHNAGISVPGKIAVTGFDDSPAAERFIPPITTIRQPIKKMVRKAFESCTGAVTTQEIQLPGELIVRQTA
jgi:LacI family transcriptional regulator